jgi:uncharacterized membrane protein YhiD involved in acid resistance
MPEWLLDSFGADVELPLALLAKRLAAALALGCVVAGVYRLSRGKPEAQSAGLLATLVLLAVLIAMVTLVIGNSVARAFSLVGALAIVRFRTVVEDTRDTAFVIFAVAVGMAVGAGYLLVPVVGVPFAAAAALLFRPRAAPPPEGPRDFTLAVRVGAGHRPEVLLRESFEKHLGRSRLVSLATARQGAALDLTYGVRLRREDDALALVAELNGIEGVQNVELRQA